MPSLSFCKALYLLDDCPSFKDTFRRIIPLLVHIGKKRDGKREKKSAYLRYTAIREGLSEKVLATIPKGILGGFEVSVLQRNMKELARKAMEVCFRVLKESKKSRIDSYSRQKQCIDHIPYYLLGLLRAHFFRQPFSK